MQGQELAYDDKLPFAIAAAARCLHRAPEAVTADVGLETGDAELVIDAFSADIAARYGRGTQVIFTEPGSISFVRDVVARSLVTIVVA